MKSFRTTNTSRLIAYFCALSLQFGLVHQTHAQVAAPVGGIVAGAALSSVFDDIRNTLVTVIAQAETAGNTVSFRVASDARMLLQNLDQMAKDLSGKVFSDLTVAQQSAISNLMTLSKEAEIDLGKNIDKLDEAVKQAGTELSRIPFVSKRPYANNFSPNYVLKGQSAFDVEIHGSLLNSKAAELQFNKVSCSLTSSVENVLKFACPSDALSADGASWATGTLKLTQSKYLGLKKDTYEYKIAVKAVAPVFASFTLSVTQKKAGVDVRPRSADNSFQNGHCDGDRPLVWTYSPAAGCTVDVSSVQGSAGHSSASTFSGVTALSPNGFQLGGVVRNTGHCTAFIKDGRGNLGVHASWNDVCPKTTEVTLPPESGQLTWTSERAFVLPAEMSSFVLTISQVNGLTKVVTNANAISSEWYVASFDPVGRTLLVRPRPIEDGLKKEGLMKVDPLATR